MNFVILHSVVARGTGISGRESFSGHRVDANPHPEGAPRESLDFKSVVIA
jgi:hypothetical protein